MTTVPWWYPGPKHFFVLYSINGASKCTRLPKIATFYFLLLSKRLPVLENPDNFSQAGSATLESIRFTHGTLTGAFSSDKVHPLIWT